MGQYFKIMSVDKKEYFTFGPIKATEIMGTAGNGAGVIFLLMDGQQVELNGTNLLGRWKGDDVRIVGDYHPTENYYDETRDEWLLNVNNQRHLVKAGGQGPININSSDVEKGEKVGSWTNKTSSRRGYTFGSRQNESTVIDLENRDPKQGDHYLINGKKIDEDRYGHKDVVCEYIATITSEWDDITETLKQELTNLFSRSVVIEDLNELGSYDPDPELLDAEESDTETTSTAGKTKNATLSEFGSDEDSNEDQGSVDRPAKPQTTAGVRPSQSEMQGCEDNLVIANSSTNEYVELPSGDPAVALSDPSINAMVTYVLFDSVQDGTSFSSRHNVMEPTVHEAIEQYIQTEKQKEENSDSDRLSVYRNEDGGWNKERIKKVAMAGKHISENFEFAGRWHSDDLTVCYPTTLSSVGNIIESDNWTQINTGVKQETAEMVGEGWMDKYSIPLMDKLDRKQPQTEQKSTSQI